ncbi:hypothetical protein CAP48_05370 [Advenella sp. S44]|nr:hypothetical protein CAP48_05370 [Advenella sp. S44]
MTWRLQPVYDVAVTASVPETLIYCARAGVPQVHIISDIEKGAISVRADKAGIPRCVDKASDANPWR